MDTNLSLKIGLFTTLITGIIIVSLTMNHNKENITKAEQSYLIKLEQVDSLKNVIDSLQTELKFQADGFDSRETRYEDVISEYEIGLSYLKDYHPKAYKDFHRIIGMRERYSRELDRENKQRLKIE